jgi:hypothetical protein
LAAKVSLSIRIQIWESPNRRSADQIPCAVGDGCCRDDLDGGIDVEGRRRLSTTIISNSDLVLSNGGSKTYTVTPPVTKAVPLLAWTAWVGCGAALPKSEIGFTPTWAVTGIEALVV